MAAAMAAPTGTTNQSISKGNQTMENRSASIETIQPTETNFTRKDIHQEVTSKIIAQLEKGVVPWQRPWDGEGGSLSLPKNFVTGNHYNGINIVMLWGSAIDNNFQSNEWASFKQWSEKKEFVRKGEKGTMIVYTDTYEKEVDGEKRDIPFLKSSFVFNRCQLQSYTVPAKVEKLYDDPLWEKIYPVEEFIANTGAMVGHIGTDAFYDLRDDAIYMPSMERFTDNHITTATEGYYSSLLHELTHWTGAPHRLNRLLVSKFGDEKYVQEELTAELGAAFLCAGFEIATVPKGNHAAYIASWLKVLKENKHCLTTAASEASKAVNYLSQYMP